MNQQKIFVDSEEKVPEKQPLFPINLNTADAARLEALPGIGPALAQRIVAYRQEHGGFKEAAEIMKVSGIGPVLFGRIADRITVSEGVALPEPTPAEEEIPEEAVEPPVVEEPVEEAVEEETMPEETLEEVTEPPAAEIPVEETVEELLEHIPMPEERHGVPLAERAWSAVRTLLLIAISALLGTAITLGVISSYNGTLVFSHHRDVLDMRARLGSLEREVSREGQSLRTDLEALQERVDDLVDQAAALEQRTKALEQRAEDLEPLWSEVETLHQETAALREEIADMTHELDNLRQRAQKFDRFLDALRDLLLKVQGPPEATPTPTLSPTPTSPTPTPTPTP